MDAQHPALSPSCHPRPSLCVRGERMSFIDSTFGAALVGLVVGACLYGITLLQTFSYFRNYSNDNSFVKSLVIVLTALDTLHLILCTRTIYWYLVTNFGNNDNLDLTTWSMALQTDCNGLIGLIVEAFFARRVWMMSKNWILTGIIVILACIHFGLGVVFTAESFILGRYSKFNSLIWVTCLGLGSAAVSDIIIAVAMCYYLYKKRTGLKRTDSVVTMLMVYSVNSGLVTSIIGTICVVTFAAMPTNFVWLSFFWVMGKCYVNSFLALLNSREMLRDKVAKGALQLSNFGNPQSNSGSELTPKTPRKSFRPDGIAVSVETITEYSPRYTSKSFSDKERMEVITEVETRDLIIHDDATSTSSATGGPVV